MAYTMGTISPAAIFIREIYTVLNSTEAKFGSIIK